MTTPQADADSSSSIAAPRAGALGGMTVFLCGSNSARSRRFERTHLTPPAPASAANQELVTALSALQEGGHRLQAVLLRGDRRKAAAIFASQKGLAARLDAAVAKLERAVTSPVVVGLLVSDTGSREAVPVT